MRLRWPWPAQNGTFPCAHTALSGHAQATTIVVARGACGAAQTELTEERAMRGRASVRGPVVLLWPPKVLLDRSFVLIRVVHNRITLESPSKSRQPELRQ